MLLWTLSNSISKTAFFFKHCRAFSFVIDLYAVFSFFFFWLHGVHVSSETNRLQSWFSNPFHIHWHKSDCRLPFNEDFSRFGCFIKENVGKPVNKIIMRFILSLGWFTHRRSRSCSVGGKKWEHSIAKLDWFYFKTSWCHTCFHWSKTFCF